MQATPTHNNISPDIYRTSDLGLAVFLFTTGHELIRTELESLRRVCFIFAKGEDTERMVIRYLSGKAEAPALNLFRNYRSLRAITFEKTGNLRR